MSNVLFGFCGQVFNSQAAAVPTNGLPQSPTGSLRVAPTYGWGLFLAFGLSLFGTTSQIEAAESINLVVSPQPGSFQQVKAALEASGDLKINADGKEVRRLPMTVEATLQYSERFLPAEKGLLTVRHYQEANAVMTINSQPVKNSLREDRRLIGLQSIDDETTLFSPQGPLSREELDLIDIPGRLAGVVAALPTEGVEIGSSWPISDLALTQLMCVDAVTKNEVEATLKEVKDGIALVRLEGRLSAAVGGISTEIDLKASLNIDLAKQQATWLALGISENRSVGHAQPGFNAISRIRIAMQPCAADSHLSESALANLPRVPTAEASLLERQSTQGGFAFFHDRRWQAMVDRHDVTILRLVDRGDLISQCNLSNLPPLPSGQLLTLEGFQAEVRGSVGDKFGSFVESSEKLNSNGLAVLRVVVNGNVQEVPIQWIYYHVTDSTGRRVSLVFTHDANVIERFNSADNPLVASLKFLPRAAATTASKAPAATAAKATAAKATPAPTTPAKGIVAQKPTPATTQKK